MQRIPDLFSSKGSEKNKNEEALIASLYQQIGQLKVELDFVKKNLSGFPDVKRAWIEPNHPQISISRQGELPDLARSSYYYQPVGVSEEDLLLMRLLDEQYTRTPFYPRIAQRVC